MPTNAYARRWHALLTENNVLQKQHLDLLTSLIPPFSSAQNVQVKASTDQIHQLNLKVRALVDDWSAERPDLNA